MSLAERVSVLEEYDGSWSREPSPARQPGRKLSFNPLGEWTPPAAEEQKLHCAKVVGLV